MENPNTWSPLAEAINLWPTREPKEILDNLIANSHVPAEPYWEMLAALSDAITEDDIDREKGRFGLSLGTKAERRLLKIIGQDEK